MLTESLPNYNYNYAQSMKILYLSGMANPDSATYANAVQNVDRRKLLKDSLCMVMLHGRLRLRFVEMLRDEIGVE